MIERREEREERRKKKEERKIRFRCEGVRLMENNGIH